MTGKILVTYASQGGSTGEVAEAIGKSLAENGAEVEVRPMKDVGNLAPYRAVVAGSPIQGQKWLPEALAFVRNNRAALTQKRFAIFTMCITLGMKDGEKYRSGVNDWLGPVRSMVRPLSEGLFAGQLNFNKLPLNGNTIGLRLAVLLGIFPRGDHRDWNAIRTWAESLRPLLG